MDGTGHKMELARNNLGSETSPYLVQHRDNPVHWQPWSSEILAAAKEANKPKHAQAPLSQNY